MTTPRTFTREELERLTPAQIEQAMQAAGNTPMVVMDTDPKNLNQVIQKSDPYGTDFVQGANLQVFTDAGVWPIYDRKTGLMSIVLKNLLPAKLSERDERGELVWTANFAEIPEGLPLKSTHPCMLHEEHPRRPLAIQFGFKPCKTKFMTPFDVVAHTKSKHPRAWEAFERHDMETKESKTEAWQQTSMDAITRAALTNQPPMQFEAVCIGCGGSVFALSEDAAQTKLSAHIRDCGPYTDTFGSPKTELKSLMDSGGVTMGTPTDMNAIVEKPCPQCDFVAKAKNKGGAGASLRFHKDREHKDVD